MTIEQLTGIVDRLHGLLHEPQTGLISWHALLSDCLKELAVLYDHHAGLVSIAQGVLAALSYPRGSEAQVRCLEEVGQDARVVIAKLK